MRIKRVDICGFKSFPDKTVLNLDPEITAIVGPNGCGKSNIVDAVKWVIGETSMKELRGSLLEDVVFAGSEVRAPLNMAEVTITMSNSEGRGPAILSDAPEISVTRRYFRDGESEYLINNRACRLKDITDIFMDSGVGADTYSVIEQGKVDMLVSSKPEDKRLIIEEAAGIVKYKTRKLAALRKMDSTRQNLLRVNDIQSEIKRQVISIQRQASKAERFKELKAELDSLDLSLKAKSYGEITQEIEVSRKHCAPIEDELSKRLANVSKLESETETSRLGIVDEEIAIESMNEQLFHKSSEIQRTRTILEVLKGENESLKNSIVSKEAEISSLLQRICDTEGEIGKRDSELTFIESERDKAREEISSAESEIQSLKSNLVSKGEEEESLKRDIFNLVARTAEFRNSLVNIEKSKRELEARIERLSREKAEIAGAKTRISGEFEELERFVGDSSRIKDEAKQSCARKSSELDGIRKEGESLALRLKENALRLEQLKARLQSLVEFESQREDFETPLKKLLDGDGANVKSVADIFSVKSGYEAAVQAALGTRLRGVVVENPEDKMGVVRQIRDKNLLRNAVLERMTTYEERSLGFNAEGFLGRLYDFVEPVSGFEGASRLLLGQYLVFKDMVAARNFAGMGSEFKAVTLDGDLLEPSGIIETGKFAGLGGGVFERRSEIAEKKNTVDSVLAENAAVEKSIEENLKKEKDIEDEIARFEKTAYSQEIRILEGEKDISRLKEEIKNSERRMNLLDDEVRDLSSKIEGLSGEEISLKGGIELNEENRMSFESRLNGLRNETVGFETMLEDKQALLLGLNSSYATLVERKESILRDIDNYKRIMVDYRCDVSLKEEDNGKAKQRIADLSSEMKEKETLVSESEAGLDSFRRQLEGRKLDYSNRRNSLGEIEKVLKEEKSRAEELERKMRELSMKGSELRIKKDMMREQVKNSFGIDMETEFDSIRDKIPRDEEVEDYMRRMAEVKTKVESLGEVNIGAIDELKEMEERHSFLTKQKEDLENTLVNLDKMIKRINQTSKKKFAETFEAVNEKFKEVFPKLFDGGKAYLTLLDEENLLESGVDIVAQPTGKTLNKINLMSGGEKALTAIALIIAVFLHRPSPFCILDEVDAPLDDANVVRFTKIIKEMSLRSQFIMITHNKVTMEAAKVLYGVTMEEHGASKVVSVRFSDERERRRLEDTLAA